MTSKRTCDEAMGELGTEKPALHLFRQSTEQDDLTQQQGKSMPTYEGTIEKVEMIRFNVVMGRRGERGTKRGNNGDVRANGGGTSSHWPRPGPSPLRARSDLIFTVPWGGSYYYPYSRIQETQERMKSFASTPPE